MSFLFFGAIMATLAAKSVIIVGTPTVEIRDFATVNTHTGDSTSPK